jgi:hypothetical protein
MSSPKFPYWTEKELDRLRLRSRREFVGRYSDEIQAAYREILEESRERVRQLLVATDDLRALEEGGSILDENRKQLLDPARYCTAPALSADTLKIIGESAGTEGTLLAFLDGDRFPWVEVGRAPRRGERKRAVDTTARLWAEQRAKTANRTKYSKIQEEHTKKALAAAGLTHVPRREVRKRLKGIGDDPNHGLKQSNLADGLRRGEFTDEIKLAGTKCDVPARLQDGRLLPIECKVSNSEANSTKRLIRETLGKHRAWRGAFGDELSAGAVLAGVFSMVNLEQAQGEGVLLFFEQGLRSLTAFIRSGAVPRS